MTAPRQIANELIAEVIGKGLHHKTGHETVIDLMPELGKVSQINNPHIVKEGIRNILSGMVAIMLYEETDDVDEVIMMNENIRTSTYDEIAEIEWFLREFSTLTSALNTCDMSCIETQIVRVIDRLRGIAEIINTTIWDCIYHCDAAA